MSEKKWREFWVETHESIKGKRNPLTNRQTWPQVYESPLKGCIHVIEIGALKELQAENEELKAEVERLHKIIPKAQNFMRLWNWLLRPGTPSREAIYEMMSICKAEMNPLASAVIELKGALKDGGEG